MSAALKLHVDGSRWERPVVSQYQPGDVLACYGADFTSRAISWKTLQPWGPRRLWLGPSHVGMVCDDPREAGNLLLVESTTLCQHACEIRGQRVSGAQAHKVEQRVGDYVNSGGRVDVYRLAPVLYRHLDRERLCNILIESFVRPGYSYSMGGALLSGALLARPCKILPGYSASEIFCSALCARTDMLLNLMNWDSPRKYHPARYIRKTVWNGVRFYVSPGKLATRQSPHLRVVG